MIARLSSLVVWGLAAAAAVAWGLKMSAGRTAVPEHATVATAAPPAGGDYARLLGTPSTAAPVAAEAPPPAAAGRFSLVGVAAPAPGRSEGWAVLAVDGKPPRTVRLGREAAPGWVLQTVGHRRVELVSQGQAPVVLELAPLPAAQRGVPADQTAATTPALAGQRPPGVPTTPGPGPAAVPGQPPLSVVPAPSPGAVPANPPTGAGMVPNQESPAQLAGQSPPDQGSPMAAPGMGAPPSR